MNLLKLSIAALIHVLLFVVFLQPAVAEPTISEISGSSYNGFIFGGDDEDATYPLPFTFPFFGRDIVNIHINTNGLIELLESGESCTECDDYETHNDGDHITSNIDAIFAANDDLKATVRVIENTTSVEIYWSGTTYADDDRDTYPIRFKVTLFSDGRIQWHFRDMDYNAYDTDLFSGVYDEAGDTEYEVPGGSLSFQGENINTCFEFDPGIPDTISIFCPPLDETRFIDDYMEIDDDDTDLTYSMPFTFPFFGRNIVSINVNTNGLIELLETGESCSECTGYCTHGDGEHIANNIDAIFAANDDLDTAVIVTGSANRVEISWVGNTYDDDDEDYPIRFNVKLFPDGRVQWRFLNMDYEGYTCDLFSGLYDEVGDMEYEVPGGSLSLLGQVVDRSFEFDPNPTPKTVPTMTEWGMIIFSLILLTIAVVFLKNRSNETGFA